MEGERKASAFRVNH